MEVDNMEVVVKRDSRHISGTSDTMFMTEVHLVEKHTGTDEEEVEKFIEDTTEKFNKIIEAEAKKVEKVTPKVTKKGSGKK